MAKLEQFLDGGVVGHGEGVAGEAVDERSSLRSKRWCKMVADRFSGP